MATDLLFNDLAECRTKLTNEQRQTIAKEIITRAKLSVQYFYTVKEACSILKCSYDSLLPNIKQYKLDVVLFREVYRVPWYDLTGYILTDHEDTIKRDLYGYIRSIQVL